MRIEVNTRVVKSGAGTEVFVTRDGDPYINFALHLGPDAEIQAGDTIEFVSPPDQQPAQTPKVASRLSTSTPSPQV